MGVSSEHTEIIVDRLIVEGIGSAGARALGRAFETELARLLETEGLPERLRQGGEQRPLEIADFSLTSEMSPETAGQKLAASVYGQLKG